MIKVRRVRRFAHANRLNPETPASQALNDTINIEAKKGKTNIMDKISTKRPRKSRPLSATSSRDVTG